MNIWWERFRKTLPSYRKTVERKQKKFTMVCRRVILPAQAGSDDLGMAGFNAVNHTDEPLYITIERDFIGSVRKLRNASE